MRFLTSAAVLLAVAVAVGGMSAAFEGTADAPGEVDEVRIPAVSPDRPEGAPANPDDRGDSESAGATGQHVPRPPQTPEVRASAPQEDAGADDTEPAAAEDDGAGEPEPAAPEDDGDGTDDPEPAAPEDDATDDSGTLTPGDEGEAVAALQDRLDDLGYWLGEPDGVYGELTRQAVLAFQGTEGLARDGVAGPAVHEALEDAGRPAAPVDEGLGIDLARQTLTVVDDGTVRWVLHTSTGTGEAYTHPDGGTRIAATPPGEFTVTRRIDGWRDAPLGRLYRPAYFNGGIAVHGAHEVPAAPASHGCARVTLAAMDLLWREGAVAEGTPVVVR